MAKRRKSAEPDTTQASGDDDPVLKYAIDVTDGRILAGRLVRLACERHLRDLAEGATRGLRFDLAAALHPIGFFEDFLQLPEADEMADARPFLLEPFQKFLVGSMFGWMGADGYRRFRTAYWEMGKGNGKTPLGAGIGLYGMIADGQPAAQVFSAATMREQARILWTDAKRMVASSPSLKPRVEVNVDNLAVVETGSFFRAISANEAGQSGKRIHVALIDEIHEHPTPLVVEKMRAGTKGDPRALIVEITNSGSDRQTVCRYHHDYSVKVLEGVLENDSWFPYICQLDPCEECRAAGKEMPTDGCLSCDQWTDEATWLKANPCLDVSITRKYLREQVMEARGMPSKENIVRRLNFCQWTQQVTRWLSMEKWNACREPVPLEELKGRPCFGGIDLASTNDLTAFALVFPPRDFDAYDLLAESGVSAQIDPQTYQNPPDSSEIAIPDGPNIPVEVQARLPWDVLVFFWVPEDSAGQRAARDRIPYPQWIKQGFIEATPGDVTDYAYVRKRINECAAQYSIQEIGFDPHNASYLSIQLGEEDGLTMVEVRQGSITLNEPTKFVERLVLTRSLRHGGNPVLTWNVSNVAVRTDSAGNKKPDKEHSVEKIDGAVAVIIAIERAIKSKGRSASVYEQRGLTVL